MNTASIAVVAIAALGAAASAQSSRGPVQTIAAPPIPPPVDHAFAGTIELAVDATDTAHRLFAVHERIPVQRSGATTLLYPRWEAASHGPSLTVTDLAGLVVRADGRALAWRRDPVEPHAFHFDMPAGARTIDVSYQIVGDADELSRDGIVVHWQRLVLYPAGWYARNLVVAPRLTVPAGLQASSALQLAERAAPALRFAPVSLERLLDAPVLAGRYVMRVPLGGGVGFDLLAPRAADLAVPVPQRDALRRMVEQAQAVFGAAPFANYTFLARMGDAASTGGIEHRDASEINLPSDYFRAWPAQLLNRDILPHEFVHAWNGLYRTPSDLWAPTPNVPQGGSLLWAYEGQTEFWGRVLAARAGLRSYQEALDRLALDAAEVADRPGRAWRALSDDVNYPAFMLRQAVPWRDWQRRKDYYAEGVLLWLAVDGELRARSGGARGIDDFARRFFAGATPAAPARTYTFVDLCAALQAVAPGDWTGFLTRWVDGHDELDTGAGLAAHGWRLSYAALPTETFRQHERENGATDLTYSLGLTVADSGTVRAVAWGGPAFRAGLAPGVKIVAVAGAAFTRDGLLAAVRAAARTPVALTVEQDEAQVARTLDYRGTLRYPRLERIAGRADGLAALFAPR